MCAQRSLVLFVVLVVLCRATAVRPRFPTRLLDNNCQCDCCYTVGAQGRTECVSPEAISFSVISCSHCDIDACAAHFPTACAQTSSLVSASCFAREGWMLKLVPIAFLSISVGLVIYGLCVRKFDGYHDENLLNHPSPFSIQSASYDTFAPDHTNRAQPSLPSANRPPLSTIVEEHDETNSTAHPAHPSLPSYRDHQPTFTAQSANATNAFRQDFPHVPPSNRPASHLKPQIASQSPSGHYLHSKRPPSLAPRMFSRESRSPQLEHISTSEPHSEFAHPPSTLGAGVVDSNHQQLFSGGMSVQPTECSVDAQAHSAHGTCIVAEQRNASHDQSDIKVDSAYADVGGTIEQAELAKELEHQNNIKHETEVLPESYTKSFESHQTEEPIHTAITAKKVDASSTTETTIPGDLVPPADKSSQDTSFMNSQQPRESGTDRERGSDIEPTGAVEGGSPTPNQLQEEILLDVKTEPSGSTGPDIEPEHKAIAEDPVSTDEGPIILSEPITKAPEFVQADSTTLLSSLEHGLVTLNDTNGSVTDGSPGLCCVIVESTNAIDEQKVENAEAVKLQSDALEVQSSNSGAPPTFHRNETSPEYDIQSDGKVVDRVHGDEYLTELGGSGSTTTPAAHEGGLPVVNSEAVAELVTLTDDSKLAESDLSADESSQAGRKLIEADIEFKPNSNEHSASTAKAPTRTHTARSFHREMSEVAREDEAVENENVQHPENVQSHLEAGSGFEDAATVDNGKELELHSVEKAKATETISSAILAHSEKVLGTETKSMSEPMNVMMADRRTTEIEDLRSENRAVSARGIEIVPESPQTSGITSATDFGQEDNDHGIEAAIVLSNVLESIGEEDKNCQQSQKNSAPETGGGFDTEPSRVDKSEMGNKAESGGRIDITNTPKRQSGINHGTIDWFEQRREDFSHDNEPLESTVGENTVEEHLDSGSEVSQGRTDAHETVLDTSPEAIESVNVDRIQPTNESTDENLESSAEHEVGKMVASEAQKPASRAVFSVVQLCAGVSETPAEEAPRFPNFEGNPDDEVVACVWEAESPLQNDPDCEKYSGLNAVSAGDLKVEDSAPTSEGMAVASILQYEYSAPVLDTHASPEQDLGADGEDIVQLESATLMTTVPCSKDTEPSETGRERGALVCMKSLLLREPIESANENVMSMEFEIHSADKIVGGLDAQENVTVTSSSSEKLKENYGLTDAVDTEQKRYGQLANSSDKLESAPSSAAELPFHVNECAGRNSEFDSVLVPNVGMPQDLGTYVSADFNEHEGPTSNGNHCLEMAEQSSVESKCAFDSEPVIKTSEVEGMAADIDVEGAGNIQDSVQVWETDDSVERGGEANDTGGAVVCEIRAAGVRIPEGQSAQPPSAQPLFECADTTESNAAVVTAVLREPAPVAGDDMESGIVYSTETTPLGGSDVTSHPRRRLEVKETGGANTVDFAVVNDDSGHDIETIQIGHEENQREEEGELAEDATGVVTFDGPGTTDEGSSAVKVSERLPTCTRLSMGDDSELKTAAQSNTVDTVEPPQPFTDDVQTGDDVSTSQVWLNTERAPEASSIIAEEAVKTSSTQTGASLNDVLESGSSEEDPTPDGEAAEVGGKARAGRQRGA